MWCDRHPPPAVVHCLPCQRWGLAMITVDFRGAKVVESEGPKVETIFWMSYSGKIPKRFCALIACMKNGE